MRYCGTCLVLGISFKDNISRGVNEKIKINYNRERSRLGDCNPEEKSDEGKKSSNEGVVINNRNDGQRIQRHEFLVCVVTILKEDF